MSNIKKPLLVLLLLYLAVLSAGCAQKTHTPEGFVYVHQLIPTAHYDIRYYDDNNFAGTRIDGYKAPVAISTMEAARALKEVSEELDRQGYQLKIFDAYRPQKAVNHFIRWGKNLNDTKMKALYYPNIDKKDLFNLGYLAKKSGHSRGSTFDLTLVDKKTGQELDMGSHFDFLDEISAHGTTLINPEQAAHRKILQGAMLRHGFKSYAREWWHYTLINEPYPNQYFDFDVN